ncbi:MAG: hypothetical protein WC365_03305 [Candidatus Babeliales bacterium]|jgi:hypothetical protein
MSIYLSILIDACNKQKIFVAMIKNLKNECLYNSQHRGNSQNPFQYSCLEKVLNNEVLHEQCNEEFITLCQSSYELAKDANREQLSRRKLVPQDVQEKMIALDSKIDTMLPILEWRSHWIVYLLFKIKNLFKILSNCSKN